MRKFTVDSHGGQDPVSMHIPLSDTFFIIPWHGVPSIENLTTNPDGSLLQALLFTGFSSAFSKLTLNSSG